MKNLQSLDFVMRTLVSIYTIEEINESFARVTKSKRHNRGNREHGLGSEPSSEPSIGELQAEATGFGASNYPPEYSAADYEPE